MWLKYGTTAAYVETMEEDDYTKHRNEREIGTTLRGQLYNKLKSSRRIWNIIVPEDECVTNKAFLIAFWNSGLQHYINITDPDGTTPVGNWIEISIPTGDLPFDFTAESPAFPFMIFEGEETDGSL